MLREMSAQQVDEWIAFYQIEPWGLQVIDGIFAHLKALIANMNLQKGKPRIKAEKFLLWPERKARIDAELGEPEEE